MAEKTKKDIKTTFKNFFESEKLKKYLKPAIIVVVVVLLISVLVLSDFGKDGGGTVDDGGYNYFESAYAKLDDKNNIFQAVTWDNLDKILNSEGNYVILFGGAWSAATQEVIPYINETAKAHGIARIYVFDFKLDGGIGEADGIFTDISAPEYEYNYLYKKITERLTNYTAISGNTEEIKTKKSTVINEYTEYAAYKDGANQVLTGGRLLLDATENLPKIKVPTLLAYNKSYAVQTGGGVVLSPVIALADDVYAQGELNDTAKKDAYTYKLHNVFESLKKTVRGNGSGLIRADEYDYFGGANGETLHLKPGESHVFRSVTYYELIDMFSVRKEFALFFGGIWNPYTQGLAYYVNQAAKNIGAERVYFFDFSLDGTGQAIYKVNGTESADIDGTNYRLLKENYDLSLSIAGTLYADGDILNIQTKYSKLYAKLLSYIPDFESTWHTPDYLDYNGGYQKVVYGEESYPKIASATLLIYSKDNTNADGEAANALAWYEAEYEWEELQDTGKINTINALSGIASVFSKLPASLITATVGGSSGGGTSSQSGGGGEEELAPIDPDC
ncbi:MAG: hypothetical protein LBT30_00775 [Clostridiales bacterium]|nr:hypothetical protein [Clostridiales bacterium]